MDPSTLGREAERPFPPCQIMVRQGNDEQYNLKRTKKGLEMQAQQLREDEVLADPSPFSGHSVA